jgi:hypothetical protein
MFSARGAGAKLAGKKEERVPAGETGHHARCILQISLAVVIVLFVLIAGFVR